MHRKRKKKPDQKAKANLDFEIDFFERLIKRDPNYIEALQILGDAYTKCGRYERGLTIDQRLAELCPNDALVHYNLACSQALLDKIDEAFVSLARAVKNGYDDADWMSKDSDLEKLRGDARFKDLLGKIAVKRRSRPSN